MRSRSTTLLSIVALFFLTYTTDAQNGRGAVTGTVTDPNGAVLKGARVELRGYDLTAVTNSQGDYTLNSVPAGSYTEVISYVGFETQTKSISIQPNQVTRFDITLQVGSTKNEIVVTAERPSGEAEAINRELSSQNILQVLPNKVITSLPNTNIADALGRLPSVTLERDEGEGKYVQIRGTEPRLSNVTIDGVNVASPEQSGVRQVKLDIVPANLVESVEINKTLSANQDGDAIGGSVNLVSKTAGEKPTFYLNGIGGFTPIFNTRALSEVDGVVSKRFGAQKKLGILFGGSFDWNGRGINDVEPVPIIIMCDSAPGNPNNCSNPSPSAQQFATYNTEDIRDYQYYRQRFGFNGSLDYRLAEGSNLYFRFLYSHFKNFGNRWLYTPTINTFTTSPTQGGPDGNMTFSAEIRRPVEQIGSGTFGGSHLLGSKTVFNWELSVSRASQEDQGYSNADFGANDPAAPINNIVFGFDRTDPNTPKFPVQNGVNVFDATQYFLQDYNIDHSYGAQLNLQASFDVQRAYTWSGHSGTFQTGFKVRNAHKFNDANYQWYDANTNVPTPAALRMTNFLSTESDPNYYDGAYAMGPLTDYGLIQNFVNSNPGQFTLNVSRSKLRTDPNNYDLIERVTAGYVMNTLTFGRVQLQTGLRFEGTNEDNQGNLVRQNGRTYISTSPVTGSGSYVDVLPSVQARFRLTDSSAIRAVYGRGLSRPNFGDLVPFIHENDRSNSVSVGNPQLNPEYANDYDLLFEQSLKPLGIIQAGFFYKDISNPIVLLQTPITTGGFAGFLQSQSTNAGSAHVAGFEISYEHQWGFLPGPLAGLGLAANYSYTTSATSGVSQLRSDNPALLRQAPNTWNVSPTYDRGRLSMRVGISHNDENIFQYNFANLNPDGTPVTPQPLGGPAGVTGDIYLYAHTQVDAQGSYRMYKGLRFIVSGLNLNNEVFGFYQGSPQFPIQREFYKPTFSFGLRYSLEGER